MFETAAKSMGMIIRKAKRMRRIENLSIHLFVVSYPNAKSNITSSLTKEQIVKKPLEEILSIMLRENISVRHSTEVLMVTV